MVRAEWKSHWQIILKTGFFCFLHLCILNVGADVYYVAPDGNDNASGSMSQPLASLQKANDIVGAGDTVYIRGGTYRITNPANSGAGISLTKSGTENNRICYWAYPGETPVFDFSSLRVQTSAYTHGFVVTGSWLHFKGFEITNVPMTNRSNCGMHVDDCGNNIFELMDFHHNKGSGVFVDNTRGGEGGHLFLNCDSHDNYDPDSHQGNGQNADGFGVHYQKTGKPTKFIGCRAWYNSDDGWDYISQEVPVITENCWSHGNGYIESGTRSAPDGNGAGFKMGSSKTGIRHIIRFCVAWGNKNQGFYANHSSGGNTWYNNTAYDNGRAFDMWASTWSEPNGKGTRTDGVILTGDKRHIMRNNIAFPHNNKYIDGYGVDAEFNSWDLNITVSESDFLSVSDEGAFGPRNTDGSLPDIPFLKLREDSDLRDKGEDVDLPFTGTAPDLGAYEFGESTSIRIWAMTPEEPKGHSVFNNDPNLDFDKAQIYDLKGRIIKEKNAMMNTQSSILFLDL